MINPKTYSSTTDDQVIQISNRKGEVAAVGTKNLNLTSNTTAKAIRLAYTKLDFSGKSEGLTSFNVPYVVLGSTDIDYLQVSMLIKALNSELGGSLIYSDPTTIVSCEARDDHF